MNRVLLATLVFAASLLAACAGVAPYDSEDESVLKSRERALIERDLDKILALFADDAVVTTSSGRKLVGKQQIRI